MKQHTEFSLDWKAYLQGVLNRSNIHFLEEYFILNNIHAPQLADIKSIEWSVLENSWLSVTSCKELALFQQQIKIK